MLARKVIGRPWPTSQGPAPRSAHVAGAVAVEDAVELHLDGEVDHLVERVGAVDVLHERLSLLGRAPVVNPSMGAPLAVRSCVPGEITRFLQRSRL